MFEFTVSMLTSWTDHPIIAGMFLLAVMFGIAGVFVEIVLANGTAAGFFIIYAIFSALLGVCAYLMLYVLKIISLLRHRSVPV